MILSVGRSQRRKTDQNRPGLRPGLRLVERSESIVELVRRQAAVGHVLAEDLRDQLSICIAYAKVARVRLTLVCSGHGRRRSRRQTERLLPSRDRLGVPFSRLRLL